MHALWVLLDHKYGNRTSYTLTFPYLVLILINMQDQSGVVIKVTKLLAITLDQHFVLLLVVTLKNQPSFSVQFNPYTHQKFPYFEEKSKELAPRKNISQSSYFHLHLHE